MASRIRWERVNDTAAIAYEHIGHPHKDRVRAWVSVVDVDDMGRVMMAVDRALAYAKVPPEVRTALPDTEGEGA